MTLRIWTIAITDGHTNRLANEMRMWQVLATKKKKKLEKNVRKTLLKIEDTNKWRIDETNEREMSTLQRKEEERRKNKIRNDIDQWQYITYTK